MSGDIMSFPENWDDFLEIYQFKDRDEVYTNGSMLIQAFRVKQMVEHYFESEIRKQRTVESILREFAKMWEYAPSCRDELVYKYSDELRALKIEQLL